MMDKSKSPDQEPAGIRTALGSVLRRSVRKQLLIYLAACVLVDLAMLAICPRFGGDCLYGFFTLIAYPVMLSGVLAVLLPRVVLRYRRPWGVRLSILAGGLLLLGAVIVASHAVAVGLLNAESYGGGLVRARLLSVELILAAIYYVPLSIIVLAKTDDRAG
jgi:hypothetical protein